MASIMAEVAAGQNMMTDKCILDTLAGNVKTGSVFKLVLLNLALGAAALTQATTVFWSDLSAAETNTKSDGVTATPLQYTKGTGITLTGANITAIAAHAASLDFADISLDNADFLSDAYALIRWVTTTADSPVLCLGKWNVAKNPAGTGTANFTATVANPLKFTAGAAS